MKKIVSFVVLGAAFGLPLFAQQPVLTQQGIVPVHNLRVEDTTYLGQLIGIWEVDDGDTLFGFVPIYVLPDSTVLVGSDTIYTTGNGQVVTLTGDVIGSGTTSIATTLANTAVTPGSYTLTNLTVDSKGRITSAANGTVNLTSQVTGVLPVANGGTGATTLAGAGIATSASGTTNYLSKYTGATTLVNSQIYDNGTNVGIGTTTPGESKLTIKNIQEPLRTTVVAEQTFDLDTTNWTRGPGWTFNGTTAVATSASGNLTYNPSLTITSGNAYEVTYTLLGYSAGTLTVAVGNANYDLPQHDATNNVIVLLPTSATGGFRFLTSTFTGSLDNVSVVEVSNPAPVLFAGQDDNTTQLYNSMRMPNANTIAYGDGGKFVRSTSSNNFFFGVNSGLRNTTGFNNIYQGRNTGSQNTTGFSNIFQGFDAGANNTIGYYNVFLGEGSGKYNTIGRSNVFLGFYAGADNKNGSSNLFLGASAGLLNVSGASNIAIGSSAGRRSTTGGENVYIGESAGRNNTSGSRNTFIGGLVGYDQVDGLALTGSNNIVIGQQTARQIQGNASNNVIIGSQVELANNTGNNQLVISNLIFGTNASGTGTIIPALGKVGIKTNAPTEALHVVGNIFSDGSNSQILGDDGVNSVATPTYSFSGDNDNGIYRPATNTLGLVTQGVERIRIANNGETRFGASNSYGSVYVSGSSASFTGIQVTGNNIGGSAPSYKFRQANGTAVGGFFANMSGDSITNYYTVGRDYNQGLSVQNNSTNRVSINSVNFVRTLYVNGDVRVANFNPSGVVATRIVGANADGDLKEITLGSGLTLTTGTLSATSTGTVSSIGLTMPTGFTVSGSPVTSSGTLAVTTTLNGPLRGNGSGFTTGNINLASEVTGTLPVANGGTGVATLTANKVLVGNGTSAILQPTNLHWDNANSRLGILQTSPAYPLDINATSAIRLPAGSLGQQPAAATGLLRYTTNNSTIEWSDGSNWYTAISGEGNGPTANYNRVALWTGNSTQTSDSDMSFNVSTGQLKILQYDAANAFTGTSVAQLHVTSSGEVITKTPRDTHYVHLIAVLPGTTVTQTAGTAFHSASYLVPEHLNGYSVSRVDYALTNCNSTSGTLTVGLRQHSSTNSSLASNLAGVTFSGSAGEVRDSSTSSFTISAEQWLRVEVNPTTSGTLNNTVEGLLVTLMLTK